MTKYLCGCLLLIFAYINCIAQKDITGSFIVDNVSREYILHLPNNYSNKPLPLVMIFHGGGGNNRQMQRYMGMDAIADKNDFITVYPQGLNKQWNDGRDFNDKIAANNDEQFIAQLLDTLSRHYSIDTHRVFATGISNGGFFSIYLSYKLSSRLLAVAPVCASIPERIFEGFKPSTPVSVLLINGTSDPLVPYNGGTVGNKLTGARGFCTSTDKTIAKYLAADNINTTAVTETIPDINKQDDCTATKYIYKGNNNVTVELVKIINGGHTLPGGSQYLPKMIIGKVCRDFEANEMIWQFFAQCKSR